MFPRIHGGGDSILFLSTRNDLCGDVPKSGSCDHPATATATATVAVVPATLGWSSTVLSFIGTTHFQQHGFEVLEMRDVGVTRSWYDVPLCLLGKKCFGTQRIVGSIEPHVEAVPGASVMVRGGSLVACSFGDDTTVPQTYPDVVGRPGPRATPKRWIDDGFVDQRWMNLDLLLLGRRMRLFQSFGSREWAGCVSFVYQR